MKPGIHVVTAAQNATSPHKAFLANLKSYCAATRAKLSVVPFRYRNPTSIALSEDEEPDTWHADLLPYLFDQRQVINSNLTLRADIPIRPTAVHPLSGLEAFEQGSSVIVGHPKIALRAIPTPHQKLPKIMVTTGVVTRKNYTKSKEGKKGEEYHTYGAAVVEVQDDKIFHLRQIIATEDGAFQDLDIRVAGAKVERGVSVEALVMGDTHVDFVDPRVVEATFGKGGLVDRLRPRYLVWHDLLDFYSRSHHHDRDPFVRSAKARAGRDSVREEVERACAFVDRHTPKGVINVLVPSNHHEHLARWLREADWKADPVNSETYHELCLAVERGTAFTLAGVRVPDPFIQRARVLLKCAGRTKFLERGENFTIRGIEVGYHGDRGSGGRRGSAAVMARTGTPSVIGHSHVPMIHGICYQVGSTSVLDPEYARGDLSARLNTHCVIYSSGRRSLVNIVNGRWRL